MKKNILIVSPYFYPEGGGLENYAFQVLRNLTGNFNFTVVCGTRKKKSFIEVLDGITVHRLKPSLIISNTPIRFTLAKTINYYIKKKNVSLIHAHTPVPYFVDVAGYVAKKNALPFVVTYHGTQLKKGSWTDSIAVFYEKIQHRTLKKTDQIVTVSNKAKDEYLSEFKEKIEVISPGVNIDRDVEIEKKPKTFLFVGQLSKSHQMKGLSFLIETFKVLEDKDIKLNVVGDGDMKEEYQKRVKRLGLESQIAFLGHLKHRELNQYYSESQALIVPSISETEGTPTVILESMANKTPVIGSSAGGIAELINDKIDGFLFAQKNRSELMELMLEFIKNDLLSAEMGLEGRKKVQEEYTWQHIAEKYDQIYQKLFI